MLCVGTKLRRKRRFVGKDSGWETAVHLWYNPRMRAILRKHLPRLFFRLLYLRKPRWDSNITPPELVEFIQSRPPGRAIDLGCGTGTNVIALAQHGWEAAGVDFVAKAIRQARRKARQAGLQAVFHYGDVTEGGFFSGQYDLILDIGCYHALPDEKRSLYRQNLAARLAPGGAYLLYTFFSDDLTTNVTTPKDLAAFQEFLQLDKRALGEDPSGTRSAWFWFKAPDSP